MAEKNRNPVVQGGMWSTPKGSYSQNTQKLLKDMMKESKLTNFQQRQLSKAMTEGSTLPTACNPTSSAKPRPPPQKRPPSKIVDPRQHSAQIRTKEEIEQSGAYEREQFHPMPQTKYGGFYEKDKERLANMMAYGEDVPPPDFKKAMKRMLPEDAPIVDRFDELEEEVNERRNFLKEMESLGKGHEYRTIIETEISRLIRDMEVIDKKRSADLARMIAAEQKKNKIPDATI